MAADIRLYLDECLSPAIARQLRRRGIDIVSVHELGLTGESDANHLERASEMGRVLVTADPDFLAIATNKKRHSGIVFGSQIDHSIGDWVLALELVCSVYSSNDMIDHVEYL